MSFKAIYVRDLGKKYYIGSHKEIHPTLRDTITRAFTNPFRKCKQQLQCEEFWALRHISFEIEEGEVIGVIGRNGAGKSTLLKILSRITPPTEGEAVIHGRTGSLLEVGTGFHPELTGRENVFLSGAILGMKKREIEGKFDDIVKFAEIDPFLDTPVKRYSSGMYVRLAFAVAAHLETEILLVDEVLAVGDAAFQNKCLGKMKDISHAGRTVVFVSHNMSAIQALCGRVLWLDNRTIRESGPASEIISHYLFQTKEVESSVNWKGSARPGNESVRICSVTVKDSDGNIKQRFNISEDIIISIEYELLENTQIAFSLSLSDSKGNEIFASLSNTPENESSGKVLNKGVYCSDCRIYGNLLNNGRYHITILGSLDYWHKWFRADHVLAFDMQDDGVLKGDYTGNYGGVIRPKLEWHTVELPDISTSIIN